jgi:hypothetical protein
MKKQCQVRPRTGIVPCTNYKPPSTHPQTPGRIGRVGVQSKAASLGFGVAKPYGDSERFAFKLSWDHRLWRVQVKSTRTAHRRFYEIGAHACWGGVDTNTKNEIDLIVAYVFPKDTWYVFPIEATRGGQGASFSIPTSPAKNATNTKNTAKPGG